jgi:hypothetical protein
MMTNQEKVRENKLRRMAARQGLKLLKSRRRDPRALEYGGYQLQEIKTVHVKVSHGEAKVVGMETHTVNPAIFRQALSDAVVFSFTLDDVERYLTRPFTPNQTTIEAMEAMGRGEFKSFNTVEELMKDLNADD